MRGILIDTNAYGAFKEGRPEAVEIAATARQHSLAVFTYDRHFREVEGIVAGNSLEDISA